MRGLKQMERLTSRNEKGELLFNGNEVFGNNQDIYNAIEELEDYEDTTLTPEEIKSLQDENISIKNWNACEKELYETLMSESKEYHEKMPELEQENVEIKKALELMYQDNKEYNYNGMGNPLFYLQQAKEAQDGNE